MRALMVCAAALACVALGPAQAQAQRASQCADRAFRQMNFWIGVWDVRWERSAQIEAGSGVNTITRELGGCVIREHFEGGPSTGNLIGWSVSTFHAPVGHWRQTWVDNQGSYYSLIGGREGDQFILLNRRTRASDPHQRMVFEDITDNSLTWRWQRSTNEGETWRDDWVIYYSRRE